MALDPSSLDALLAAGATAKQIVALVKAELIADQEKLAERRYRATIRKRNQRQRHRDNVGQSVTPLPPCPPSPSDKEKVPTPLKEINSLSPLNPPSPKYFVRFDEFWELYPRKEAKKDAHKAYGQQLRAGISPDTIIDGLRQYHFPEDPTFCPLPASWLRGQRWEDQQASTLPFARPLTQAQKDAQTRKAKLDALLLFDSPGTQGNGKGGPPLGPSDVEIIPPAWGRSN